MRDLPKWFISKMAEEKTIAMLVNVVVLYELMYY
jgi:hypothetical protein